MIITDCQLEQRDDGLWHCTRPGCDLPPLPRRMARNCAADRQRVESLHSSNLQSSISNRPLVLVLGLHRSLSSCLAECLERLGVFMGRETQGGECQRLRYILEGVMRFPRHEPIVRCSDRGALRRWLADHFAAAGERLAGAKYPHLCRLAGEIEAIHRNLKLIHVARPLADSIQSLVARSARATGLHATREECEALQRSLHDSLRAFLRERPHLRVAAENLLRDPARELARVIEYLGLDPTPDQRAAAIAHVDPALAVHTPHASRLTPHAPRWTDDTAILIKTVERPDYLDDLIGGLLGRHPEARILVADDSPSRPPLRHDVQHVRLPPDTGLSGGRNWLVDQVATPYVLLLDDDYLCTDESDFGALHEALIEHDLDILAGEAVRPGRPDLLGTFRVEDNVLRLERGPWSTQAHRGGILHRAHFVGNFFLARTEALRRCRWDDRLVVGEHVDFFLRAWAKKLRVGMLPAVKILDRGGNCGPAYHRLRIRAAKLHRQAMGRWARRLGVRRYVRTDSPHTNLPEADTIMPTPISRKIHQIWIGPDEMPAEHQRWAGAWRALHPAWQYRLWREGEALGWLWPNLRPLYDRASTWAQKADLLRLAIVYYHGGVYLDTDFEPLRPLDPILDVPGREAFCAIAGDDGRIASAVFGAVPRHPLLAELLRGLPKHFRPRPANSIGPPLWTAIARARDDVDVLDREAFYPITWETRHRLHQHGHWSAASYAVHHFAASWVGQ